MKYLCKNHGELDDTQVDTQNRFSNREDRAEDRVIPAQCRVCYEQVTIKDIKEN